MRLASTARALVFAVLALSGATAAAQPASTSAAFDVCSVRRAVADRALTEYEHAVESYALSVRQATVAFAHRGLFDDRVTALMARASDHSVSTQRAYNGALDRYGDLVTCETRALRTSPDRAREIVARKAPFDLRVERAHTSLRSADDAAAALYDRYADALCAYRGDEAAERVAGRVCQGYRTMARTARRDAH